MKSYVNTHAHRNLFAEKKIFDVAEVYDDVEYKNGGKKNQGAYVDAA